MSGDRPSRWQADQRAGFFGYSPRSGKQAPQPLRTKRVDLDAALADVADDLSLWFHAEDAGAQPFSGGVLDSWPARYVAIFEACRQEDRAVTAFLQSERAPRG